MKDLRAELTNLKAQKQPLDQEGRMRMQHLQNRLDHLIRESESTLRDSMKTLTGSDIPIDTSALRDASPETKLKGLEEMDKQLTRDFGWHLRSVRVRFCERRSRSKRRPHSGPWN
jgi:hypothetical protein